MSCPILLNGRIQFAGLRFPPMYFLNDDTSLLLAIAPNFASRSKVAAPVGSTTVASKPLLYCATAGCFARRTKTPSNKNGTNHLEKAVTTILRTLVLKAFKLHLQEYSFPTSIVNIYFSKSWARRFFLLKFPNTRPAGKLRNRMEHAKLHNIWR